MQELPGLSRTVTMMSQCGTDRQTDRQTDGVQKLLELLFATKKYLVGLDLHNSSTGYI